MVAISLYRGNLHRVSDAPRRWPMPPRSLTLEQFRILSRKRGEALARVAAAAAAQKAPKPDHEKAVDERKVKVKEEPKEEEEGEVKDPDVSDPKPIKFDGETEVTGGSKMTDDNQKSIAKENVSDAAAAAAAAKGSDIGATEVKVEASNNLGTDKEKRKIELEKKLEVRNQKKHHLVQILKQILNAEEEIKRRNAQYAASRSSITMQPETAVDMGSATRHVPRLSVEVNFSGDQGAESDVTANHSTHGRQMHQAHGTSPSSSSLAKPFQQNMFLPNPRSSLATAGHGQSPSNLIAGNTGAVMSSPSRFASSGHQGHHHSSSPPVSVPGSHFMASSPSPAASGGSSSIFRDSLLTSSS